MFRVTNTKPIPIPVPQSSENIDNTSFTEEKPIPANFGISVKPCAQGSEDYI